MSDSGRWYSLQVRGDFLGPDLMDGDLLMLSRVVPPFVGGIVHVALPDGHEHACRYYEGPDGTPEAVGTDGRVFAEFEVLGVGTNVPPRPRAEPGDTTEPEPVTEPIRAASPGWAIRKLVRGAGGRLPAG